MKLEDLMEKVSPRWRQEFVRFVQTGEASDAFLDYLDEDPGAQEAVEEAFEVQAAGLERLSELLESPGSEGDEERAGARQEAVTARMALAISEAAEFSDAERHELAEGMAALIRAAVPADRQDRVRKLVEEIEAHVGGA